MHGEEPRRVIHGKFSFRSSFDMEMCCTRGLFIEQINAGGA
jgi:hypothetical protein